MIMAADEEKTTIETPEAGAEAPKKGGSKGLIFGGIGLAVVVIGVALALFVVKPMMSKSSSEESSGHGKSAEVKKSEGHGSSKKEGEGSFLYSIKDIVVNPAGTGGSRFLSVSFGFELKTQSLETDFEDREPLVRDALITILSSKTVAQLTDTKQKEIMRYQIKKRLADLFHTEDLEAVYYTDFVLQ